MVAYSSSWERLIHTIYISLTFAESARHFPGILSKGRILVALEEPDQYCSKHNEKKFHCIIEGGVGFRGYSRGCTQNILPGGALGIRANSAICKYLGLRVRETEGSEEAHFPAMNGSWLKKLMWILHQMLPCPDVLRQRRPVQDIGLYTSILKP